MSATTKPFRRNVVGPVTISAHALGLGGEPAKLEVSREEWLGVSGRYSTIYSARKPGRLGWDTGRTLRSAIMNAEYRAKPRSALLKALVSEAEYELKRAPR